MDEHRPGYGLKAPGPSDPGSPRRLPGREAFPRLDDHLVEPEVTRDQVIGGRKVDRLDRWLGRAVLTASTSEVVGGV